MSGVLLSSANLASNPIVRYFDAPYSDAALAEGDKIWIDAGVIDLSNLPPDWVNGLRDPLIKHPREGLVVKEQPHEYQAAHAKFIGTATHLLGPETVLQSSIYFDHASADLREGELHTFGIPHMDGTYPGFSALDPMATSDDDGSTELKLIGTAMNILPTGIWQGALRADDFEGDSHTHLKPGLVAEKNLVFEELPLDHLVLMSPGTVHFAQRAKQNMSVRRHFLRWQLKA